MKYTEKQKKRFRKEFALIERHQRIAELLMLILIAPFLLWSAFNVFPGLSRLVIAVVSVGFIIFRFINWRCPACHASLDEGFRKFYRTSPYCPHCKVQLKE